MPKSSPSLTMIVTAEEKAAVTSLAKNANLSTSNWLRNLAGLPERQAAGQPKSQWTILKEQIEAQAKTNKEEQENMGNKINV